MKPAAAAIAGLLALSAAPFAAAQAQSGKSRKAPSPPARTGYDKSWFISEFWSGEYPAGFSVTRKSTILMARSAMDKNLPRSVACAMPYLAVIHPWNTRRNQKSKVTYWSASRIVNLIAKEDFVFESNSGGIPIKKDDVIEYLRYDAEGAFEVRIKGKQYTAHQDLFDHVQENSKDQFAEEEWALLTCQNGTRAYIDLGDIHRDSGKSGSGAPGHRIPGINRVGPAMMGYGKARDLTAREAQELESDVPEASSTPTSSPGDAAQSPPGQAKERSLWSHNGSVVSLQADGSSRQFFYQEPRPGMAEAGAEPGALLFSGRAVGKRYVGTAYIFNERCGRLAYAASGPIRDGYRMVELHGQAPRVDRDCRVIGHIRDVLRFSLIP